MEYGTTHCSRSLLGLSVNIRRPSRSAVKRPPANDTTHPNMRSPFPISNIQCAIALHLEEWLYDMERWNYRPFHWPSRQVARS